VAMKLWKTVAVMHTPDFIMDVAAYVMESQKRGTMM
jgi:hypothetical protein